MTRMLLLALPSVMVLLNACAPAVSSRPCPRVTEFPDEVQEQARGEMLAAPPKPALVGMMNAMAGDREFNRAICP